MYVISLLAHSEASLSNTCTSTCSTFPLAQSQLSWSCHRGRKCHCVIYFTAPIPSWESCPTEGHHNKLPSVATPKERWEGPVGQSARGTVWGSLQDPLPTWVHTGPLWHSAHCHCSLALCPHASGALPSDLHMHSFHFWFFPFFFPH